jgi:hypothetical protein
MGNLNLFNFYLSSLFTMCYDPNGIKYGENMGKLAFQIFHFYCYQNIIIFELLIFPS